MTFWIIISALALLVAMLLTLALIRQRRGTEPAAAYDLRVYRDQLKEVERDLARGVIAAADADRVRTEVSRRILAADAQLQAETKGDRQSPLVSVAVAAVLTAALVGGSLMLYRSLGAPGYGDLALADRIELAEALRTERPSQAEAEAGLPPRPPQQELSPDYVALVERLRETVAQRPDDLQGHVLLARNEAASGNFTAAYSAQQQVLRIKGATATAADYVDYADMMILAAGGYVSPEAEGALRAALERDRGNGAARYYWGLMMAQTGRPDVAFRIWDTLLREGPADAPWIAPIRFQIEDMAMRAGVDFVPPASPPLSGPSAEDMAAAADMNPEERMEMIRGMVGRLMQRLANEGGPPDQWARLIGALGVLGDKVRAQAIYDEAMQKFGSNEAAVAALRAAALQAGIDTGGADDPSELRLPTAEELRPQAGAGLSGPTREDMEAAASMSAQERTEMIRGMVNRLSDRLATEGGPPAEWARLIGALGVLGETDEARAVYDNAVEVFGGDEAALAAIRDSARQAGLKP